MMELRKIEKAVKKYEILLLQDQENAKKHQKEYREDVEIRIAVIEAYLDDATKKLQTWCDTSVEVWDAPTNNVFQRIKRAIQMAIVNYHLNYLSGQMARAGKLQELLAKIKSRFAQFQYFCSN